MKKHTRENEQTGGVNYFYKLYNVYILLLVSFGTIH